MDEGTKTLLTSRTFYGVVISALAKLATIYFGYEIDDQMQQDIIQFVTMAVGFGGDGLALYGRVKATKKITKK